GDLAAVVAAAERVPGEALQRDDREEAAGPDAVDELGEVAPDGLLVVAERVLGDDPAERVARRLVADRAVAARRVLEDGVLQPARAGLVVADVDEDAHARRVPQLRVARRTASGAPRDRRGRRSRSARHPPRARSSRWSPAAVPRGARPAPTSARRAGAPSPAARLHGSRAGRGWSSRRAAPAGASRRPAARRGAGSTSPARRRR